jgi:hypothetical protein
MRPSSSFFVYPSVEIVSGVANFPSDRENMSLAIVQKLTRRVAGGLTRSQPSWHPLYIISNISPDYGDET